MKDDGRNEFPKPNKESWARLDQAGYLNSLWNPSRFKGVHRIGIQDFTTDIEELVGLVVPSEIRVKVADLILDAGASSIALRAGFGSDTFAPSEESLECNSAIASSHPGKTFAVCGPTKDDINRVLSIGTKSVVVQATSSRFGLTYRLRTDLRSLLSKIVDTIEYARSHGLQVVYMASDSTRAERPMLHRLIKSAEEAGCKEIVLADSNGCATPFGMYEHVKIVSRWTKLPIAVHCHNDYGIATANALTAAAAGARNIQTCALGVGERSGLASFEEVALSSELLLGAKTGVKLSKLAPTSKMISDLLNYPLPPKKPVIGYAATSFEGERFAKSLSEMSVRESRLVMMPYLPEIVGGREFLFLGSECGTDSLRWRLARQVANVNSLDDQTASKLAETVRVMARAQRKPIDDGQINQLYTGSASSNAARKSPRPALSLPYMLKNGESTAVQMYEGVVRRTLAHSEHMMVVEFRFTKGAKVPLHSHPNEQCGYVASGEVRMTVSEKVHNLGGGDSYMIPADTLHGTEALIDSVLVDVFHPPRLDYALD